MSEPDFDRIADRCLARVYEARHAGLLVEHGVVVDELRRVWNARGAADVEAAETCEPSDSEVPTYWDAVEAIKALDA